MPDEIRCKQCDTMLFKAQGSKIIQKHRGSTMMFEPVGSVTTACRCGRINVFVPMPVRKSVLIAG